MPSPSATLPEANNVLREIHEQGSLDTIEQVERLRGTAVYFSTCYLAAYDRASQDPVEYVVEGMRIATLFGTEFSAPPQEFFRLSANISASVIDGRVNSRDLGDLITQAHSIHEDIFLLLRHSAREHFSTDYRSLYESFAGGSLKLIGDALHVHAIAKLIRSYVNEQGLVLLYPETRKIFRALVADEATSIPRIRQIPFGL